MADESSAAQLYGGLTKLAYVETQMSLNPRPPFSYGDKSLLFTQASSVADCAKDFRQKKAVDISQDQVFACIRMVNAVLGAFALINNQISSGVSKDNLITSVDKTINEINSL